MTHEEELNKAAKHYSYIDWSSDDEIFAYDISKYDAFIAGAKWFQEHYNITIQYIADGSTSAYGKQPDNWKPKI